MVQSYVYALVDPRNDEVRYIGISTRPSIRYADHLREAKKDTATKKRAWIRSLLNQDLKPTFAVLHEGTMSWDQLCTLEVAAIAQYTVEGHNLTNVTEGGDGLYGFAATRTPQWGDNLALAIAKHMASLTTEQKKTRSDKRVATIKANNGGKHPGYTKGRTSPNKGRTASEETKEKMRAAHRARWDRLKAEGRYTDVCANIAAGTKRAMNGES